MIVNVISKMTDKTENFSNLIYIQASFPQKPLSSLNYNGDLADKTQGSLCVFHT
jgi:hypothetical protein